MSKDLGKQTVARYSGLKGPDLSSFHNLSSQYANLVNKRTFSDELGDAFTQAGSGPADGPAADESNGIMLGIGAGIKGYNNNQKNLKLSDIERQTAQLLELDAGLKQQMYEDEAQTQQVTKFFKQNTVPISELSKASLVGDTEASSNIAKGILNNYKKTFQDQTIGDFDGYRNGVIYFENLETGNIEGRNLMNLIYQSGVDPVELFGQDASMVEAGLSPGARQNYENTQKVNQLSMDQLGLKNQKLQSEIDGNYYKMNDTQETPYNKELANHHLQYLKETREKNISNTVLADTLNEFEQIIRKATAEGTAGSTPAAALRRHFQKYLGEDKNVTLAKMMEQVFYHRIKEAGGSNPSGFEFTKVLETIPSIEKNPEATLQEIQRIRQTALKDMFKYQKIEAAMRKSNYQVSPDDPSIFENSDTEYQDFLNSRSQNKQSANNNSSNSNILELKNKYFIKQ